ncbi:MAG: thioredoxin family protein [Proteobacteria bacterium]|nr:thioredoxin family protein [Pseudomonadota bacterium]
MTKFRFSRRAVLVSLAMGGAMLALPSHALAPGFTAYTKAGFDAALKEAKPVLVHVHADWCPVCKKQQVVFGELSKTPEFGKLKAFTVDFDKETEFKKTHNIGSQSIILVFKGGKEVARLGGATEKDRIQNFVAGAIN